MKLTPYVLAVLALMTSRGAIALEGDYLIYYTGNKILTQCQESSPTDLTVGELICAAYVSGVVDMYELTTASQGGTKGICTPTTAPAGQLIKVFTKFLEDHPEELHGPAALLVVKSLLEAFPCPKSE